MLALQSQWPDGGRQVNTAPATRSGRRAGRRVPLHAPGTCTCRLTRSMLHVPHGHGGVRCLGSARTCVMGWQAHISLRPSTCALRPQQRPALVISSDPRRETSKQWQISRVVTALLPPFVSMYCYIYIQPYVERNERRTSSRRLRRPPRCHCHIAHLRRKPTDQATRLASGRRRCRQAARSYVTWCGSTDDCITGHPRQRH